MSAYAWLAKLNLSPESACRCGHNAHVHLHGKSCTALVDETRMRYCKCENFKECKGEEMSKEKKERKPKGEGRVPTLAPFVDAAFKVYMSCNGKEREAMVLSTGIIRYKEKEFTSPSGFANAVIKEVGAKGRADGWKVIQFNKNGERVELNVLRGSKSPLKAAAAPKREKKAAKPKRVSKPRARKPQAQHAPAAAASADGAVATA